MPLQVRSLALGVQHDKGRLEQPLSSNRLFMVCGMVWLCVQQAGVWHAVALCPQEVSSSWPGTDRLVSTSKSGAYSTS